MSTTAPVPADAREPGLLAGAALVAVGGVAGTLARWALTSSFPAGGWTLVAINLAGSLLLGLLTGAFARRTRWPRAVKTLLGTGFLGAFTSYSALALAALDTPGGWQQALVTVAGGVVGAAVGIWAGERA